jgi:carboxypeptidase Q
MSFLALACSLALGAPADDAELPAKLQRIVDAGLATTNAYDYLVGLCDGCGHRLSGSEGAARAVTWAQTTLRHAGADRVALEDVMVPKWVRGDVERARIESPAPHDLSVLALGGSIATPRGGITAEVICVRTFDELRARAAEARGKIVLFTRAMGELDENGRELGYGSVVSQRTAGAIEAAKAGAVASLIHSVGSATGNYRLPHTGMMSYADGVKKIPHAALAAEDALLIQRFVARKERVVVNLELSCVDGGMAPSSNVIAEITGRERPEEIVVVGGHLDSWDVGTGASDDGVGVVCSMEVIRLLKQLDLRPRRTIRCVLFMNEENGLAGGNQYAKDHEREMDRHVAAIEMDGGAFGFSGFGVSAGKGGRDTVEQLLAPLRVLGKFEIGPSGGGADIGPMAKFGVPLIGVNSDGKTYFKYHHTEADTVDKVDPQELARHAAALTALTFALADMAEPLPRLPPPAPAR